MSQDGRVSQYANLHVYTLHSKLCVKLHNQFGPYGPLVWIALILAGKRELPQGTFSYASEDEAWAKLIGHDLERPDWTINDFFRYTGRLKKTRDTNTRRTRARRPAFRTIEIVEFYEWQRKPGPPRGKGKRRTTDASETHQTYATHTPGDAPDARQTPANHQKMQNARARGNETRRDIETPNGVSMSSPSTPPTADAAAPSASTGGYVIPGRTLTEDGMREDKHGRMALLRPDAPLAADIELDEQERAETIERLNEIKRMLGGPRLRAIDGGAA